MRFKKEIVILGVFLAFLSTGAIAQLAGTKRIIDNYWFPTNQKIKMGAPNADVYYNGTNLVLDVTSGGGKVSMPDGVDLGTGGLSVGTSVVFEGTTADPYETTLTVTDPTADNTVTIPNASGTVIISGQSASLGAIDTTSTFTFEGTTADPYETTVSVTDPTADNAIQFPNTSGFPILSTADIGSANSVSGGTNSLVFEGATADPYEVTLTVQDPAADRTITIPDQNGTLLVSNSNITVQTIEATSTITSTSATNIGWNVVTGANTQCETTCVNACVFGQDTDDANKPIVSCADASADRCVCAGAN